MFYNVDDTYAELYDDAGECIVRRAYDPETDAGLPTHLEYHRAFLLKKLAATRYDRETAGVAFGGETSFIIATDRQSQSMLTSALVVAPDTETHWKMADGTFAVVTPRQLALVVAQHVATCFAHEADVSAQIRAAETLDALDALDADLAQGWP